MKYEILQMLKQEKGGALVNTSAAGGLVGLPGISAYAASKHGIIGVTRAAALEYAPLGIRINAVCPGGVDTSMAERMTARDPRFVELATQHHPMKRLGMAQEIANAAVWLCSDEASFVTGVALPVDGGYVAQ